MDDYQTPMNLPQSIKLFLDHTATWASAQTITSYRQRLDKFAAFAKGRDVGSPLILEYKAWLSKHSMKESTIAGYFVTLKLFLGWAVRMELLPKNPMPERMGFVIAPSEKEPITLEERDTLTEASTVPGYEFWTDAINVAWHTGLRLCDIALLCRPSLDVPNSSLKLIPKKTKRYARLVHIPVPVELIKRLSARSNGDYIFPEMQRQYARDQHKSLSAQFCYLGRKTGIKKGFHCFRHAAVTRWLDEGVSATLIADMTGLGLNRILTYAHASLETKREALGLNRKETAA